MTAPLYTAQTVTDAIFREVIEELLIPLFPGTELDPCPSSAPKKNVHKLVTQVGSGTALKLMPHSSSSVCCQIRRAQKFASDEKAVVQKFLGSIDRAYRDWTEPYRNDTAASVISEVVASSVAPGSAALVGQLISTLISWSQQTYEGERIAFSIGVEPTPCSATISLQSIMSEDFLKVLSNGQDTLVVVDSAGNFVRHETLELPSQSGDLMAPIRLEGVAKWTHEAAGRAAVTLNRSGEVLAFKQGSLRFARRRGDWRYFAHDSVIARFVKDAMAKKSPTELRREIYRTALDAAFARSGACVGVMIASQTTTGVAALIAEGDRLLGSNKSAKAEAVAQLISGRKFQELDRRLRLALVSVDGATVVDHLGSILTVGAILTIESGGASGGGREEASRALAKYGLGIKVSNDGYIRARNRKGDVIVEVA